MYPHTPDNKAMKLRNIFFLMPLFVLILGGLVAANTLNTPPYVTDYYAYNGTAVSTNVSYVVVPPKGGTTKASVDYANATSDLSTSKFTFYTAGTSFNFTGATTASATVIPLNAVTGLATNDVVILYSPATGLSERCIVSSVASLNVTLTAATVNAYESGAQLWEMTAGGTIPVGAATKEVAATSYIGQNGKPVLAVVTGTSAVTLNVLSGRFIRVQ